MAAETQRDKLDQLNQAVGRIEGAQAVLANSLAQQTQHVGALATQLTLLQTELRSVNATVERVRKPLDAMISLRNLILGAAILIAAVGGILSNGSNILHFLHLR